MAPIPRTKTNPSKHSAANRNSIKTEPTSPLTGTKTNPIRLSFTESKPKSLLGSKKRPIQILSSDEDEDDDDDDTSPTTLPPRKKLKPNPRATPNPRPSTPPTPAPNPHQAPHPPTLRLTLAIPPDPYPYASPPTLLCHLHSRKGPRARDPSPNFIPPPIQRSARVTALLRACPLPPFLPAHLSHDDQVASQHALAHNRFATNSERGAFFAWRAFAEPSRPGREAMVCSGLDSADLEDEWRGRGNRLPRWKKGVTGRWARRGWVPDGRRTPDRGDSWDSEEEEEQEGEEEREESPEPEEW